MSGRRSASRARVLTLGGLAAAIAATVALAPVVTGARLPPVNPPITGWVEGSGFDHNRAHLGSTDLARSRAAARARLCARRRLGHRQPGVVRGGGAHPP